MTERKILFRGFHPDEKGKTTIILNGEKIHGEWVYGFYTELPVDSICATIFVGSGEIIAEDTGSFIISITTKQCSSLSPANPLAVVEAEQINVIFETVGQWMTTDKNGKDVFEGDNVLCAFEDGIFDVRYDEQTLMWVISNGEIVIDFDHCYNSDIELIGNKWESEVTE